MVALLALPFLTRIYTPEDFTVLATYAAILALLTVISCLRFEIAIPMPKEQEEAVHLLALSVISVISLALLTWLGVSIGEDWINKLTNQRLTGYLWLLPLGVFFSGLYSALQYWMTREKAFPLVAKTRITQAVSGATAQLGFGYAGITPLGLLLGQLLNSGAGIYGLLRFFLKEYKSLIFRINLKELRKTFKRYDRFPKYSTWEALTNSAGIQLPVLIIAILAAGAEAGFLMLAMRLLSAPMGLIGSSVAQVYLSEAAERYHHGELKSFTNRTIIMLAKVGFVPFILAGITAPFIVPFVFGQEWQRTGILISWMVPWFFMQFIASPISMSLHITNNQRVALVLQIVGLILRGGAVWGAAIYSAEWVGEIYAASGTVFYIIYIIVVYVIINKNSCN
jgi:O-antigen/teichoic acid export membrane protein